MKLIVGIPKVAVVMPSNRSVMCVETALSLVQLLFEGQKYLYDIRILPDLYIDKARNELVRQLLELQHHTTDLWSLWLDDDQIWPPYLIPALLANEKPVVGGLYFSKTKPYDCTAFNFVKARTDVVTYKGFERELTINRLQSWPDRGGSQVDGLGMGATLIRVDIFSKMREFYGDEKWFRSKECGEDVWFFHRLRELGHSAWLDTSVECGHITKEVVTKECWEKYHSPIIATRGEEKQLKI